MWSRWCPRVVHLCCLAMWCVGWWGGEVVVIAPQDKTASKFYLNGFNRFSKQARFFAVSASVASRVSEAFQQELMTDSRVAQTYPRLWAAITEELRWVIDIPLSTWEQLAEVTRGGMCGGELRDSTIRSSHIAFHFVWRRVLKPASGYPWRLCRGDLQENVEWLKQQTEEPTDAVTAQLWKLLTEHNYPEAQIRGVLEVLGEAPWSSLTAEQQHGSLAMLHKWHPDYGVATLVGRSLALQATRLLPSATEDDRKLAKLQQRLRNLESAVPTRVGGSHMLTKSLIAIARGRKVCIAK